jgi:hypothetical protein
VENNISIIEMLERLLEKWHVVFTAVNSFIKLTSSFDNDFEYNLQRNVKQVRDDKSDVPSLPQEGFRLVVCR